MIQVGKGYLEFDIKTRKDRFDNFSLTAPGHDVIRLVNNAFVYTLHDARISTSSGVEIEQNKFVWHISTILRLVTQKDGDILTYFDIIDKSKVGIEKSSLKQIPINNHSDDNRGIITGHLTLEYSFGSCKSFEKLTRGPGFDLDLRTSNRKRDILYTTLGYENVSVTIYKNSVIAPQIRPSSETQVNFNEDISKTSTLSYESRTTDREPVDTAEQFQLISIHRDLILLILLSFFQTIDSTMLFRIMQK